MPSMSLVGPTRLNEQFIAEHIFRLYPFIKVLVLAQHLSRHLGRRLASAQLSTGLSTISVISDFPTSAAARVVVSPLVS